MTATGFLPGDGLPPGVESLLRKVGEAGEALGLPTFVVGGFVRDLLLGKPSLDLDVVVEGKSEKLAAHLHRQLGGRLTIHDAFGTASLRLREGRMDFASARRESYEHPAALPKVEHSSLRDDLFRRDFTINALALQLNPPRFGRLVDFFGGKKDLQRGLIRVMHVGSFLDDPTRIFRAIRFEQRFGFGIERRTERLLRQALAQDMLSRLTGARIRDQLRLLFSEPQPVSVALRAWELGVLDCVSPSLTFVSGQVRPVVAEMLQRTEGAIEEAGLSKEAESLRWLLFLLPFLQGVSPEEVDKVSSRLYLRRQEKETLLEVASRGKEILAALNSSQSLSPSQVWELLEPVGEATIIHLLAQASPRSRAGRRLRDYLRKYRHVSLEIDGEDLRKAGASPGPALGAALKATLKAKLDGLVAGRRQELNFALKQWKRSASTKNYGRPGRKR